MSFSIVSINSSKDYPMLQNMSRSISSLETLSLDKYWLSRRRSKIRRILETCWQIIYPSGIYSTIEMISAGFQYTREGDVAYCTSCNLKLSQWTHDVKPFTRHAQERPDCAFVQSIRSTCPIFTSSHLVQSSNHDEQSSARSDMEIIGDVVTLRPLFEVESMKQVRKRSFASWSKRLKPSAAQMIEAGFFYCDRGDRVICIYCNIICQGWMSYTGDPWIVHKSLSPNCCLVLAAARKETETSSKLTLINRSGCDQKLENHIDLNTAYHRKYIETDQRLSSFSVWPGNNLPSIDAYVRAGFFYVGKKQIVTCFYCNGSLQNWSVNDDPIVEHVHWFPDCDFAREVSGKDLYERIREISKAQRLRNQPNNSDIQEDEGNLYDLPADCRLSKLVAAYLDLPMSQQVLNRGFEKKIVKRCLEDRIRLNQDDFATASDLLIACMVLKKQIDLIDSKRENIIIPRIAMDKILGYIPIELSNTVSTIVMDDSSSSCGSDSEEERVKKKQKGDASGKHLCLLCYGMEPSYVCIPCGHLSTCASCAISLRSCPMCHLSIDSFVRIHI